MSDRLPSGGVFRRRVLALGCALSVPAIAIVLTCLFSLLELTSMQWTYFLGLTCAYAALIGPPLVFWQWRWLAPVAEYLDRREDARDGEERRRLAFARVMDLPRIEAVLGFVGWLVPTLLVTGIMDLRWEAWGWFEDSVLLMSGVAAGFVTAAFLQYLTKAVAAPVRAALAEEITSPAERSALVHRTSMRAKLVFAVTGVTLVPVIFAVLLFQAMAARSLEAFTVGWQHELLDIEAETRDWSGLRGASGSAPAQWPALDGVELIAVDVSGKDALSDLLEEEVAAHVSRSLAEGVERGDSGRLPSERVFAWRRIGSDQILLVSMPQSAIRVDSRQIWIVFGLLLVATLGVAALLGYMLSNDVSRATEWLRAGAKRLAGGDLRRATVFESEDELGDLSRSFEGMAESVRTTVSRVAEAAGRVEATAMEMAEVSASVASVTADQVSGIRQAASSMDAINGQVRGIADSAQALNVSVEESSSSILELGAAGQELNETASVLSERVNEVSTSIEQMVKSVRQVLENAEALGDASIETSSSMEEMATSMREVDESAEETARLSRQVVESAESGQQKMVQTIQGMEAIREATETAERVIRSLGGRASEIGAIVDVIDDVADETNLLALNAAIIAAQAGEHGRAFSVVADEIKDLADRVLASTKEIGSQIRAVQEESNNAIGAIERGTRSVASGVDLTAEAGVSLEEITRASRESGQRIGGIVAAVREQARAASHVVELMERVRNGVDEIRAAAADQDRGNEVVYRGSVAMRDVAAQVRGTTEEQARGSSRIQESIEGVRDAVEQINGALQEQSAACRSAVEFLEAVHERTGANEESSQRLDQVARSLVQQAEALRQDVRRFRLG